MVEARLEPWFEIVSTPSVSQMLDQPVPAALAEGSWYDVSSVLWSFVP
jgi:hypothetical protein